MTLNLKMKAKNWILLFVSVLAFSSSAKLAFNLRHKSHKNKGISSGYVISSAIRQKSDGSYCAVDLRGRSNLTPSFAKSAHKNSANVAKGIPKCSAKESKYIKKVSKKVYLNNGNPRVIKTSALASAGLGCVFGGIGALIASVLASDDKSSSDKKKNKESKTEASSVCVDCIDKHSPQDPALTDAGVIMPIVGAIALQQSTSKSSKIDKAFDEKIVAPAKKQLELKQAMLDTIEAEKEASMNRFTKIADRIKQLKNTQKKLIEDITTLDNDHRRAGGRDIRETAINKEHLKVERPLVQKAHALEKHWSKSQEAFVEVKREYDRIKKTKNPGEAMDAKYKQLENTANKALDQKLKAFDEVRKIVDKHIAIERKHPKFVKAINTVLIIDKRLKTLTEQTERLKNKISSVNGLVIGRDRLRSDVDVLKRSINEYSRLSLQEKKALLKEVNAKSPQKTSTLSKFKAGAAGVWAKAMAAGVAGLIVCENGVSYLINDNASPTPTKTDI